MVQRLKEALFRLFRLTGISALVLASRWRRSRLLILCYHGVSLDDEHIWSPLYMAGELFERRLECIRRAGCHVVGLDEGAKRLEDGSLPPGAVTLTFDDGFYDFYAVAWPILRKFNWPVTLYATTYYMVHSTPVFDPMCSYLLWKSAIPYFEWGKIGVNETRLDSAGRTAIEHQIQQYCRQKKLSGQQKHELLQELAARLEVDFEGLSKRRVLHLMTSEEAATLASAGLDIELHTHRHRVYRRWPSFEKDLHENRSIVETITARKAQHFCYPGGYYLQELWPQLATSGIRSAVTCQPGLASKRSNPYLLPRVVDTSSLSETAFFSWLVGVASWLPHRHVKLDDSQLAAEDA